MALELGDMEIAAFLYEHGASEDTGNGYWDRFYARFIEVV
jgi:hypothetical protein